VTERSEPEQRPPAAADTRSPQFAGLDEFLRRLDESGLVGPGLSGTGISGLLPKRVNADPQNVEKGLAQLVLTLIELLRQLMERQAVRRMEGGTLTDDEIERLGQTFMLLEKRMEELKKSFGLEGKDLNIDLGPLGKLL
jgi:hypothetical protein